MGNVLYLVRPYTESVGIFQRPITPLVLNSSRQV
jgi:hypothetical protein